MKRLPLAIRMILAVYLIAIGSAILVSWIGADVAQDEVEKRLVDDTVANSASLMEELLLPINTAMLSHLSTISGGQVVITDTGTGRIVAASLPAPQANALRERLRAAGSLPRQLHLGSEGYIVGSQRFRSFGQIGLERELQLHLLVPEARITEAKRATTRRIIHWTALVIAGATIVTILLSWSITGPLRRLAVRVDQLSQATGKDWEGQKLELGRDVFGTAPKEVLLVAESFDRLLNNLADSQNRLARVERLAALGKVAASVAHELRNPLSGMKMHVRLLQDTVTDDPDSRESLDLIGREIERLDLYVQELMALTRDGSRKPETAVEAVDLAAEAGEVLTLLAGKLEHAGVTVEFSAPEAAVISAHRPRLRQVVMNLLLNAADAMPDGGAIQLSVTAGPPVRLAVRDHGPGVQVDGGTDIFEAFISTKFEGAGLGLYISRQIITEAGGDIGYTNHDDGAEFWIEMPPAEGSSP